MEEFDCKCVVYDSCEEGMDHSRNPYVRCVVPRRYARKDCPTCHGTGKKPKVEMDTCPICEGEGTYWIAIKAKPGQRQKRGCAPCDGTGWLPKYKVVAVVNDFSGEDSKPTGFASDEEAREWFEGLPYSILYVRPETDREGRFYRLVGRIRVDGKMAETCWDVFFIRAATDLRDKLEPGWRTKD